MLLSYIFNAFRAKNIYKYSHKFDFQIEAKVNSDMIRNIITPEEKNAFIYTHPIL